MTETTDTKIRQSEYTLLSVPMSLFLVELWQMLLLTYLKKKTFESKGRKKWKSHWFLLWIHCLRTFSHSQSFYCTSKQRFMGMAFSHLLYQKQHKLVNKLNIGCQGTNQLYGWDGFSLLRCQCGKSKEMTEYLAFFMGEFLLL